MVGFLSDWWSTCDSQERTVSALKARPEYSEITVLRADWDTYRKSAFIKELKVPRRSTLVMFRGGVEIARVIAQTNKNVIEDMFKAAVS